MCLCVCLSLCTCACVYMCMCVCICLCVGVCLHMCMCAHVCRLETEVLCLPCMLHLVSEGRLSLSLQLADLGELPGCKPQEHRLQLLRAEMSSTQTQVLPLLTELSAQPLQCFSYETPGSWLNSSPPPFGDICNKMFSKGSAGDIQAIHRGVCMQHTH